MSFWPHDNPRRIHGNTSRTPAGPLTLESLNKVGKQTCEFENRSGVYREIEHAWVDAENNVLYVKDNEGWLTKEFARITRRVREKFGLTGIYQIYVLQRPEDFTAGHPQYRKL